MLRSAWLIPGRLSSSATARDSDVANNRAMHKKVLENERANMVGLLEFRSAKE
jgi:hypothetical protein